MAKTYLLQAVGAAALLAALPAFAQSNLPTGDTGAGGRPNLPTAHAVMPGQSTTGPADVTQGTGTRMAMEGHMSHHSAMLHPMHGRSDKHRDVPATALNTDQLNDQSYQAARSGQAFNGNGSTPEGSAAPGGAANMSDVPGRGAEGGGGSSM